MSESCDLNQFDSDELSRYARQMALPMIDLQGQEKLKKSRVLVVGAGGLASPVLMYLVASGVGHIGIVDDDNVDASNLHRQVLFTEAHLQHSKTQSAKEELEKRNHFVDIKTFQINLSDINAIEIITGYDVVVDCTDNFPSRYLINDACHELGIVNVYASISQFEGQCTIFCDRDGPCYRCLYAEPPPQGLIPTCAEGGVLGVLPGLLGVIQATEVIKYLLGIGESLVGRLLTVDLLNMDFKTLVIKRQESCVLCSGEKNFKNINRQFDESCQSKAKVESVGSITACELQKKMMDNSSSIFLLDVREAYEYEIANMGGYLISLNELSSKLSEIDTSKEIIIYCRSGNRSAQAVRILQDHGIDAVSLDGGIVAWQQYQEKMSHQ